MMSRPKPMGGTKAGEYFERDINNDLDEYYTKNMVSYDVWRGGLAKELGFEGQITPEDFRLAIEQMGNVKNRKKSKEIGVPIDFYDMPVSAPKSFSLLIANPKYRNIALKVFNDALDEVMDTMEKEIGYRIKDGNQEKVVYSGSIMQAKFIHYFNREGELTLHGHIPVFNMIKDENGDMKAINRNDLYNNYMKWGLQFREILAQKVQNEMNLGVVVTSKKKGLWQIKGLDDNLMLDSFSTRKKQIAEYLKKHNLADTPKNRERATKATRKKKSNVDLEKVIEETRERLESEGYYPRQLLNGREYTADDKYEVFMDALGYTAGMEFAFSMQELKKNFLNFGVTSGCKEADFEQMVKRYGGVVEICKKERYDYNRKEMVLDSFITTKKNIAEAEYIKDISLKGKGQSWGYKAKDMETLLQNIEDRDKAEAESKGDQFFPLTVEQCKMLLSFLVSKDDDGKGDKYIAANGLAGTGKSFSFGRMVKCARELDIEVIGAATGGSQADELAKSTNIKTNTIAKLILDARVEAAKARGEKVNTKSLVEDMQSGGIGNYTGLAKSAKKTICIVDEAGQIPQHEMYELMKIAEARGDNFRVCFSGDWRQIHAVGAGTTYEDMIKGGSVKYEELLEIYRQKKPEGKARSRGLSIGNKKPEPKTAEELAKMTTNERKKYNEELTWYEKYKDPETTLETMKKQGEIVEFKSTELDDNENLGIQKQSVVNDYCKNIHYDKDGKIEWMDGTKHYNLVLTATNSDKDAIDEMIHQRLLEQGKIGEEKEIIVDAGNKDHKDKKVIKLSIGERVLFRKNTAQKEDDIDIDVKNGSYGVVTEIDTRKNTLMIKTDDGNMQKVNLDKYDAIQYGYSTTHDSAQGKTCHDAYCYHKKGDALSIQKFYVIATRTIKDDGIHVYTNDYEDFKTSALRDDGKVSAEEIQKVLNRGHIGEVLENAEKGIENYQSPLDRSEKYRIQTEPLAIDNGLERTLDYIPQHAAVLRNELPIRKEKEYEERFSKVGIMNKVYINKADVVKIIDDVKSGKVTVPGDSADIKELVKDSEYARAAEQKTYREIYRPKKIGGRARRMPHATLTVKEMKKREQKTWNSFQNDFNFRERYARAVFAEVSKELIRIKEREEPVKKKEKPKVKEYVMER